MTDKRSLTITLRYDRYGKNGQWTATLAEGTDWRDYGETWQLSALLEEIDDDIRCGPLNAGKPA